MESVHALDVVCRHLRSENADVAMSLMRCQKSKLSSSNYRLRQKVEKLENQLAHVTATNDRLVSAHSKALTANAQIYHSLKKALDHVITAHHIL